MYCREITYGSPSYAEAVALRDLVLREPLDLEFSPEQISDEYRVSHIGAFDDNDRLIGILIGQPSDKKNDTIRIRQVAVDPQLQSQGIGGRLMQYAEVFFQQGGFTNSTLNSRVVAARFYEKINYKVVGDEFFEVGIPHLKMTKRLV